MSEGRQRARATGSAALFAAALLLVLALETPRREAAPCSQPVEVGASSGHSTRVRCDGGAGLREPRGPARLLFGLPIDPNRADLETLQALPGIGPVRATGIASERERRRFHKLSDLGRVSGIGPRTLERLAGLVSVADNDPSRGNATAFPRQVDQRPAGALQRR